MIAVYRNDGFEETSSLLQALLEGSPGAEDSKGRGFPVISVVGAGGKTTLIHRMAEEFVREKQNVFVTTTTHIMKEDSPWFLSGPSEEQIRETLQRFGQVWAGMPAPGRKLTVLPDGLLRTVLEWKLPVLVEADGAKKMPVKAPAEHEPVIIPETTHLVSVYGLDAVGRPVREVCFRKEKAAGILKKKETECITETDIAVLASSPEGGRKSCPAGALYSVILNKADDPKKMESALCICRELRKRKVGNVIISSRKEGGI